MPRNIDGTIGMSRLARCGRPDLTATSEEQEKSKNDADHLFGTAEGKKTSDVASTISMLGA